MGLLSPVIIGVKSDALQRGGELGPRTRRTKKWDLFTEGLKALSQIRVPRYYHIHQHTPSIVQIHRFSDASNRAYAAVIYLRTVYSDGMVSTCILALKTHVAPMKKQTTLDWIYWALYTILSRLVYNILEVLPT